ncbi:GlsB/YeaQ/YmgE family stress response membrane protein [Pseudonocardia hispaniensis]|uniref:GlsB/YeaQ/YmgE family stress response membrane protein n=1 Tax=Pseudonocardia hispaniensis TaxID=904933 RepID=A0ABW1J4W8_9PSEU
MQITGIISAIIIGLIIGALGRLVVPGKQPIPIWLTLVIGIAAAFIGGAIAAAFGYSNASGGIPWIQIILQVAVAAIGVALAAGMYARRGSRRGIHS